MGCHIRKKALTLLPVACLIMYLLLIIGSPDSAHASIHKYPESSTKVMYRSQQSLRDNLDGAWQAVLFKRLNSGHLESVHLRLVGFPGIRRIHKLSPALFGGSVKPMYTLFVYRAGLNFWRYLLEK